DDLRLDRALVGHVAVAALLDGVLLAVELELAELEGEVTGEVLDGREVVEEFEQAALDEPVERIQLNLNEVWDVRQRVGGMRVSGCSGGHRAHIGLSPYPTPEPREHCEEVRAGMPAVCCVSRIMAAPRGAPSPWEHRWRENNFWPSGGVNGNCNN